MLTSLRLGMEKIKIEKVRLNMRKEKCIDFSMATTKLLDQYLNLFRI